MKVGGRGGLDGDREEGRKAEGRNVCVPVYVYV